MRVSDSMVSDLARQGVGAARSRALAAQRVATTGKRVEVPSDDPAAAAAARRRLAETERIRGMMRTAENGITGLDVVDAAYAHMGELAEVARAIAVQGANGTLTARERAELSVQIGGLRSSLLAATSERVDGRYVLNGMREDAPPYDATGTFVGDRNVREVEVSPGYRVAQTVAVGDVLSPTSGTDVLASMEALRVALAADDIAGIRAGIDAMRASTDQIAEARSHTGTLMASMEMARSLGERLELRLVSETSALLDADPFSSLSELEASRQALEQAVSIAARLPMPGLVQSMR